MERVKTIWIIGMSLAGKSTLARMTVTRVRQQGIQCLLLDGDEVRGLYENKLGFDPASRRKQTQQIKRMTIWAIKQALLPVVSIVHPFEDDRLACRQDIDGYFEVHLECDMKELIVRDSKSLYLPALSGEKKFVVGVDIPFDSPRSSDLTLDSNFKTPEENLDLLWAQVESRIILTI